MTRTSAALGEGIHGAGRGARPLFYMTLSTGIGGGYRDRDGIYRGADSYAGELGHITIRPTARTAWRRAGLL